MSQWEPLTSLGSRLFISSTTKLLCHLCVAVGHLPLTLTREDISGDDGGGNGTMFEPLMVR